MTETLLSRMRYTVAGAGILLALPAQAQAQEGSPQVVPRVEITGSNIRRAQAETASPVQTLSAADIEKSGKTSVAELLQTLAVDNQGSVPSNFGNGFAAGAAGVSLRGLGAASTLVLLNGRRVAPYGLADDGQKVFSDLNIIPLEAVERVEILKDGASAIYGSDAIAGVVNVILRKDYQGTAIKASYGKSRYRDGRDSRVSLTHGFGDLDNDRYNLLLNLEYGEKREIWNHDRDGRGAIGRGAIGRADLRDQGFSAVEALGGTGAITTNNAAGNAINGNVRNPATFDYYNRGNLAGTGFTRQFPAAACGNFTGHPQGDPGGGCLIDAQQIYSQIQPQQKTVNFFGRGAYQINPGLQTYAELNLYHSDTHSATTPSSVSGSVGSPAGPVSNAGAALGADHPDNPYFGTAARLRYLAADVGPRVSDIESTFVRLVAGIKGSVAGWDIDSALLYSQNKISHDQTGYLQRNVAFALLNPTPANVAAAQLNPAYAALPPGSVWRIAENAGLNSAALYAALSPQLSNDARTRLSQIDFKASRELNQLPGGALGLALGAEFRHETTELGPTPGTETGNIIGLGYSAYKGNRNSSALYAELLAPVLKTLELSAALRADHFSDVGNSYTPKIGAKWTPLRELALRTTFAKGFRAPSAAENGVGGLAAFSTAADPLRCALGVAAACDPASIAVITSPNPALQPERSKSYSAGLIWDPRPRSSVSLDVWEIRRTNEINQEQTDAAIAAGHIARDPSTATAIPGDPGAITAVLANYVNSASTKVRGADLDARQGFALGNGWGNLTFDLKWTHLFKWLRTEQDGSQRDFAGTHGNCDVTNCIGTPDDRVNLGATWERNDWRVSALANYRGSLSNTAFKDDPDGCASHFADGSDAPRGCKIASFTTIDLTLRWKAAPRIEVFGSIQNLFDKIAPLDPLTYGAVSYNPLDYSGAVGRYFSAGMRYKF
ncbi:TonB-dependent receptor [Janthinobacterium agaricidamnosum]|uniref:TonB-dependent Receptor Plug domain protein n=1 Tax=Janthinobacterium agaricidamnosum NBRC 102515 = DSM 9628 TaxID=1349767 RepID=W0VC34_9BURK|nr:TonB-dependent receptor [Janthinobacterium agaricidamnosum]CDG84918.1 tonB-dependent Receptor Plug domain protein [Janthinobacterium agaricidamnosum NBRC 102515 = DSM 9628]